jgi:8-amino-7-oxononanoate synthase
MLRPESNLVDFYSNDYLGFARSPILKEVILNELHSFPDHLNGSTGSRLLSGNTTYAEDLEKEIANSFQADAGLIYNSGYDANLGLFSSLPQKGDTIIYDESIHASIIDGARLSYANRYSFKHNNIDSLEEKLKNGKGNCYVVIESVYSMDGDIAPIENILALTKQYKANLIVDEAHAVGLYGKGIVCQLSLENEAFARIVTFGKALGCHGAIVLGSNLLREYLINYSRSFIYTTAASFYQLASIKMACQMLDKADKEISTLIANIEAFKTNLSVNAQQQMIKSDSAIQCIITGSTEKAKELARHLQNNEFEVRPILSPTVPAGSERLRICLHSFNTNEEVLLLAKKINELL